RGGVAKGLVEIPGQVFDPLENVGLKDQIVMIRLKGACYAAGVVELVVFALSITDRKRLQRLRRQLGGRGYDGARVDAAAHERAQRPVAHEMQPDGFFQQSTQSFDKIILVLGVVGLKLQVPIALDGRRPARRGCQYVPWLEFMNAVDNAFRRRSAERREKMRYGVPVELALHFRELQDGFHLGGEDQPSLDLAVVERLDAQAIAGQKQLPVPFVPDRQPEHAAEVVDAALTIFFIQMDDGLGIARGVKDMAAALQLAAELLEVVDFAVEDYPDRSVLVVNRLAAGLGVDDAEAAHAEADAG